MIGEVISEEWASAILLRAVVEHRSQELLITLMNGGAATLDPDGQLVVMSGDLISKLAGLRESREH